MPKEQLEEIKAAIRTRTVEYLQNQGVDPHNNFPCPNPTHRDSTPSAHLLPNKDGVYCFGKCGRHFDIFELANFYEEKPLTGKAFIKDNVLYLAEKFGIPAHLEPLTDEELYELNTYRAYRIASDLITSSKQDKIVKDEIKRRGWSEALLRANRVGTVKSFDWFREEMRDAGFSATFLDEVDLGKRGGQPSPIFQQENLIFTITDEKGRPVGFAGRNLKHKEGEPRKYVNQMTTGLRCNIYRKGQRLHGFDVAQAYSKIYLFEGYADVLTARQHGLAECVSCGGTALTKDQVLLIKSSGTLEVCICFDGDEAGQKRMIEILDTRFSGHRDLSVQIKILPEDMDPDDFIRTKGMEAFRNIPELSAFQWRLTQFDEDEDAEKICHTMIPLIANEPSPISAEGMCRDLALRTGWNLQPIRAELYMLLNQKDKEKERERQNIVDKTILELERSPADSEATLSSSLHDLAQVSIRHDEAALSGVGTVNLLKDQKQQEEIKEGQQVGFVLGPKFHDFQPTIAGELKGTTMIVGGRGNAGKSSVIAALAHSIAMHHEQNNTIVVYHTIDDSPEQLLPKFICLQDGTHKLELNHVMFPKFWAKHVNYPLITQRNKAYSAFNKLVKPGHLMIKGAHPSSVCGGGNTLTYTRTLLHYLANKYPDKHILYILDNFHDLQDFQDMRGGSDASRIERMGKAIKSIATEFQATVLSTMEYTKMEPGTEPNMNNLRGSAALQYVGNIVCHVYNDVNDKGSHAAEIFHMQEENGEQIKYPRLKLITEKNKVASFKGNTFLNFWPACSDFGRVPIDELKIVEDIGRQESPEQALGKVIGGI